MTSSRRALAGGVEPGRRTAGPGLLPALALLLVTFAVAVPLPAASQPLAGGDELVWVTLGEDLFVRAAERLAPPPGLDLGIVLERVDEYEGVVMTRMPLSAIDELVRIVHEERGACGGFVKHESLEEAVAAMARLRDPREAPEVLPFTIDQAALVGALTAQVEEANLLGTISALSNNFFNRYHLHPSGTQAANWIRSQWEGYAVSRPDVTVELFSHGGITPQPSVILTIPGTTLPGEYVIVGGHEDSTRSGCSISSNPNCVAPGADDDASGIAVLSEVIRILLSNGFQPQRTVQFMAYAAEEVGLDGSDHIAQTYQSQGRNVVAMLQQDMTAYHGSAQDVFIFTDSYTNSELNAFLTSLVSTYQPGLLVGNSSCGYGCSDHYSWGSRGYRASLAFEASFSGSNPYIHTIDDTTSVPNFSAAHAAKFARLALSFAVEAAVDGAPVGTLEFTAASFSVAENAGTATVTVTRTGGGGAASVHCRTVAGGSATPGVDYTETDATLSWADGETGTRECTIPILDDALVEGDETVELALEDPLGAIPGGQLGATLTIVDDDSDTTIFSDGFETGDTSRWSWALP